MKIGDIVKARQCETRTEVGNLSKNNIKRIVTGKIIQITDYIVTLQLKYYKESFNLDDIVGNKKIKNDLILKNGFHKS